VVFAGGGAAAAVPFWLPLAFLLAFQSGQDLPKSSLPAGSVQNLNRSLVTPTGCLIADAVAGIILSAE
jgi:hypothetical protein